MLLCADLLGLIMEFEYGLEKCKILCYGVAGAISLMHCYAQTVCWHQCDLALPPHIVGEALQSNTGVQSPLQKFEPFALVRYAIIKILLQLVDSYPTLAVRILLMPNPMQLLLYLQ